MSALALTHAPALADPSVDLNRVAAALRSRTRELSDRQLKMARRLPSYSHVPDEELLWSARRNVDRVVNTLTSDMSAECNDDERTALMQRSLQGIDAEDVVHCYRLVMDYLCDEYVVEAARLGISAEATVVGMRQLWRVNDRFTNELVKAKSRIDLGIALRQDRQRQVFLQRVMSGVLRPAEIALGGAQYGLTDDGDYFVVKAGPIDRPTPGLISHLERFATGSPAAPLLSVADGDLIGIMSRPPIPFDAATPIAVVGSVRLARLPDAFREAARLLDVAKRFGKGGVIEPKSLGVLLAVANEPELGEALFQKYVVSVHNEASAMAEVLLTTVDTFLSLNRAYQGTASSLHIHVNTLRHRIGRFEELVGDSFSRPEVALEAWWAFRYAEIRRA